MKIIPPKRISDNWGSGHYGASRGDRTHKGVDYACYPGSAVFPEKNGEVTKLGYCYSDDLAFRYVEIMDGEGIYARYLYVEPIVAVGDMVSSSEPIGRSQELGKRYPLITEHVHLETFKLVEGVKEHFDPNAYYLRR